MIVTETKKKEGTRILLPPGWRWVRLGEVCKQDRQIIDTNGDTIKTLPYIGLENVESNTGRISVDPLIADNEVRSTTFVFDERHVLYGKLRPYLNKVALPNFKGRCTTELIPLLVTTGISREFIAWILRSGNTVEAAMKEKTGSRMPRANMDSLLAITIPLPATLAEQERIAGVLNEQMVAVEKARAAAEARLEAAKALPTAYLRAVFESEEAKGWQRVRLKDVCDVVNGFGFPEHLQGRTDLPYPFIKVSDMNALGAERVVTFAANTVNQEVLKLIGGRVYPCGTVIFPKVGGALLTNKKRILGTTACFDNNVMGVVPKKVASDYVFHWFQTIDLRTLSNVQALPSVKQSSVASLEFPLAPPAEQERIVAVLNERIGVAGRIVQTIQQELETINALPAALLRRAFTGGL